MPSVTLADLLGNRSLLQRFVIGGSQSVLCVSLLHGLLLVIVILIDGSNIKHINFVKVAFEFQRSHVFENHSNFSGIFWYIK